MRTSAPPGNRLEPPNRFDVIALGAHLSPDSRPASYGAPIALALCPARSPYWDDSGARATHPGGEGRAVAPVPVCIASKGPGWRRRPNGEPTGCRWHCPIDALGEPMGPGAPVRPGLRGNVPN